MIRRWSRIIKINLFLKQLLNYHYIYFFLLFKKSILFKKFYFKNTKFNRKSLIRLKHKGKWFIYSQILKYWIKSYNFLKLKIKNQFNFLIFEHAFLIFNFNYTKTKIFKNLNEFNFFFISYFKKKKNNNYKNLSFLFYFLQNIKNLYVFNLNNNEIFFINLFFNNSFICLNKNNKLAVTDFENNISLQLISLNNKIIFNNILNFYKILNFLWIYILFKR